MRVLSLMYRAIRVLIAKLCMKIYMAIAHDLGVSLDE